MADKGLSVTIDNQETYRMIEKLIRKIDRPEPLLKIVGKFIQAETKKMFMGKRPDTVGRRGVKWPKLAKSTIQRKLSTKSQTERLVKRSDKLTKKSFTKAGVGQVGAARRPLLASGKLKGSLLKKSAIKIKSKGLVYGTNVTNDDGYPYPAVHQTGGKNIPQRRWLFLTSKDLMQIATTTRDWLMNKRVERIG